MSSIRECGTCKASIVMAMTPAGAQMPVDAEPGETAGTAPNVLLLAPTGFGPLAVTLSKGGLFRAREEGCALRTSHWATCADRAQWRARMDEKRQREGGDDGGTDRGGVG